MKIEKNSMKRALLVFACVAVFSGKFKSQSALESFPLGHSTVLSVDVIYSMAIGSFSTVAPPQIPAIAQTTVILQPAINVSRIYFKVLDKETRNVLYQVDYLTSSPVIYNNEGKKLFENNGGNIFISSGAVTALKPYIYQIQTANSQGDLSEFFSAVR